MTEHTDNVKNVLDFVAIFSTFGAFLEMFNPLFALIGAVVGVMRIYEMATGKDFYKLLSKKKAADAEHE
tara:strand:- start:678 stop:884 length:207 start_codon:yes stop_codon:yes gene_type:complete